MDPVRVGTFIKTNSPHVVEVLGTAGIDFAVIDQEHGPYDRSSLDLMMLAGRAAHLPLFVRIPDAAPASILGALDLGAAGLLVPHVDTPAEAAEVVQHAKFAIGRRGFSNAGRWADYGTLPLGQALERGDRSEVICMIETPEGVANAQGIAETPGISGVMVGRADLTLAMGLTDPADPAVAESVARAVAGGRAAGVHVAVVLQSLDEVAMLVRAGADMLIIQSDQTFLRQGARTAAQRARSLLAEGR